MTEPTEGRILLSVTGFNPHRWHELLSAARPVVLDPDGPEDPSIRYAVVWKQPAGILARLPNLEAIFSIGAGVDHIFAHGDVPDVPIVRIVAPNLAQYMTEYVVWRVLDHLRQGSAYRIQQLTDQLKSKGDDPDQEVQLPADWSEFASWCDENLAGRLILTPNAHRGTRKPLFQDVETAAKSLLWLATEGRDRFRNGGGALANIPIFDGAQNAPCGADEFDFDWNSRRFLAEWHIKNGGNTRDPSRCLRIYYCFDQQTQQIIVADMPAHRRTGAT